MPQLGSGIGWYWLGVLSHSSTVLIGFCVCVQVWKERKKSKNPLERLKKKDEKLEKLKKCLARTSPAPCPHLARTLPAPCLHTCLADVLAACHAVHWHVAARPGD